MIIPLTELLNKLIEGAKVEPLWTAGLLILAVVLVALAIDGLRGQP